MIAVLHGVDVIVRWEHGAVGLTGWGWFALLWTAMSIGHHHSK